MSNHSKASRVLRMNDLLSTVHEDDILGCFDSGDNVLSVNLVKLSDESRNCAGYGYIYFGNCSDAVNAFNKYQNQPILGTLKRFNLSVCEELVESPLDEFQLYVGDLSLDVTDQDLYSVFHGDSSHVTNVRVVRRGGNISCGYGFVQYDLDEFAYKSLPRLQRLEGLCVYGYPLVRETYRPGRTEINRGVDTANGLSIFVGNINLSVDEASLSNVFAKFDRVISVKIVPDRGFGFLSFQTHTGALAALSEMQNTEVFGQRIHCTWGKDMHAETPTAVQQLGYEHYPPPPKRVKPVETATRKEILADTLSRLIGPDKKTSAPIQYKSMAQINDEYMNEKLSKN